NTARKYEGRIQQGKPGKPIGVLYIQDSGEITKATAVSLDEMKSSQLEKQFSIGPAIVGQPVEQGTKLLLQRVPAKEFLHTGRIGGCLFGVDETDKLLVLPHIQQRDGMIQASRDYFMFRGLQLIIAVVLGLDGAGDKGEDQGRKQGWFHSTKI